MSQLPRSLTLPSGIRVVLGRKAIVAASAQRLPHRPLARALALLEVEGALACDGAPLALGDLALRDVHLLMALLCRARLVAEPEIEARCDNCGETLMIGPSAAFEPGPFVDGELDDPELDRPFDFARSQPLPPLFRRSGVQRSVRLAPRTLSQARLLYAGRPLAISRAAITALGIEAIGNERRAAVLARTLSLASDATWTALGDAWESAHYAPRMFASRLCGCGARVEVPVPAIRPFDALASPQASRAEALDVPGFPAIDAFEQLAERARRRIYASKGVRNIPLIIETGVPDCDDGGEPLLGSYTPPSAEAEGALPEIRLYYRTFQSEFRFDSGFDVENEIAETIEHEVEHHLFFLSGDDPMDDEERVVIARDRQRLVGKAELLRRDVRSFFADLGGFVRVALPLLLLLLALALFQSLLR